MLARILTDPKYQMHDKFKQDFPGTYLSLWIFERLTEKHFPQVAQNISTHLGPPGGN
jgi:hypothetical protein